MAKNMNLSVTANGNVLMTVAESKDATKNIQAYEYMISCMLNIGRTATLKIVEAIARVNVTNLFASAVDKDGNNYKSINAWAIDRFSFSKAHVSEMLSVAKYTADPETGKIRPEFEGLGYAQLLALTKNQPLLTAVSNGDIKAETLVDMTAKELKNEAVVIEDNGEKHIYNTKGEVDNAEPTEDNADATPSIDPATQITEMTRLYEGIKGAYERDVLVTINDPTADGRTTIVGYEVGKISFGSEVEALRYLLSQYELNLAEKEC